MPKHPDSLILLVDDTPANLELVKTMLALSGYRRVITAGDPLEALQLARQSQPDLIILDMHMPKMSGLEVLKELRRDGPDKRFLPILGFTADSTKELKIEALAAGANDFLHKPGDMQEIILRVENFLEMRWLHKQLEEQNLILEERVIERTYELEQSRLEVLHKLARAAEFKDDATGQHTLRVAKLSARLARAMGLQDSEANLLELAALLHDVGKISIPDSILLKNGSLTPDQIHLMRTHTTVGAEILANSSSPILRAAQIIARSHHERWDGRGYPDGLSGEAIPLHARIVAVADVFDALTNERPYKGAWSTGEALVEISKQAGSQFDPQVVRALLQVFDLEHSHLQAA